MKNYFLVRYFHTILLLLLITAGVAGKGTYLLKGYVYDTSLKPIPYARVTIRDLSDKNPGNLGTAHVIYSDKKGEWRKTIPLYKKVMVRITSNGFKPMRKLINMEIEKTLNNTKTVIRAEMLKGFQHIPWGSFEHTMLYVRQEDQKRIEELVLAGKGEEIQGFIEKNFKEEFRKNGYLFAGYVSFQHGDEEKSALYFKQAGSKLWYNLKGRSKLTEGNFVGSAGFYLEGSTTRARAFDLMSLGEELLKRNNETLSRRCYSAALDDFSKIILEYSFKWSDDLLGNRIQCARMSGQEKRGPQSRELKKLLGIAAEYCKKLKKAEIYYYCNEEKIDKVVLIEALYNAVESPRKYFSKYKPPKLRGTRIRDKYIYDLQFVLNENGVVEEARKLVNEYPDMKRNPVPVLSYKVIRPLYGPNTLIGSGWQGFFNYSIAGRENLLNTDTVIIEAFPKWSSFMNQMYGKLWVSEKDGSILKIEWKHQKLNRKDLRTRGLILNMKPQMKFISIYGKVRGGLRFPSEYRILEQYEGEGELFTRLDIRGTYKNYTFFGVDIDDVQIKE